MERIEIENGLKTIATEVTSDTILGTWKSTSRIGLPNASDTRSNTPWKKAEYVVAYIDQRPGKDNPNFTLEDYLSGWKKNSESFGNQYLFLEITPNNWKEYNSAGDEIADDETLKNFFSNIKKAKKKIDFSLSSLHFLHYLSALRTKPFVLLAGISGTGKSRIVRKLAQATNPKKYAKEDDRWKDNRPDNFELIQVKPNWHNSMDVTGFYSSVSKRYEFTPFVRFIVKAWQHPDTPYFLCLDEMNLAPVEEYFAEFLSAIESRSLDENDQYITDPIIKPFNEFEDEVKSKMLKELFKGKEFTEGMRLAEQFSTNGLTLPPNLMVMGTVNMDETTFTFSRKVLDRAMSIEMNEVDYDDFLKGDTDTMPLLCEYNHLLVKRPQKASEVKDDIDSQKVIDYLKSINALLEGTPFKLGYRAANEAILYVAACQDFANDGFKMENALDEFTLMKVLSRIEGDDSRLALNDNDERLGNAGVATTDLLDNDENNPNVLHGLRAIVRKHIGVASETEKKINTMLNTLEHEHFVSYWN